jgi:hypothetical protein
MLQIIIIIIIIGGGGIFFKGGMLSIDSAYIKFVRINSEFCTTAIFEIVDL